MQTSLESGEIRLACKLRERLLHFLEPVLIELDTHLGKRLVRNRYGRGASARAELALALPRRGAGGRARRYGPSTGVRYLFSAARLSTKLRW